MGGNMNIETIKNIFQEKKEVHFKLFSLEYTIIEKDGFVLIYEDLYCNKQKKYKTIDDVLEYYTIYNESIISNQDRIQNIN